LNLKPTVDYEMITILYVYNFLSITDTVNHKKTWQFIFDYNSG